MLGNVLDMSTNPFLAAQAFSPSGSGNPSPQSAIEDLAGALRKSLDAGFPAPDSAPGSLAPVMPESLENTITSIIWTEKHLALLKKLKKQPVTNTVHQFIRLLDHGHDLPPFVGEGLIPDLESDPSWERIFKRMRIAVRIGRVTDVANLTTIVGPSPNALAESNRRTSLSLLGSVEEQLYFGDSSINDLSWDGILKQMEDGAPADLVINKRGEHLTPEDIDEGVAKVLDNAGFIDEVWMSNGVRMALGQIGGAHLRLNRPDASMAGGPSKVGVAAQGIESVGGMIPFQSNYFLQPKGEPRAAGLGTSKPAAPVINTEASAGTGSEFLLTDAGKYYFKIVAVGTQGYSVPTTSSQITVAAGETVTITLTDAAIGDVTEYWVYRSEKNGAADTAKLFKKVKFAGPTSITDDNSVIPGMTYAFGFSWDPTVLEFAQLGLPAVRVPLAKIDLSERFAVVLVGTPIVKAPTKLVVWKNCNPNRID